MKTGLITSDTYQNHNTGEGHPEKIDRVTAVIENFKKLQRLNLGYQQLVVHLMQDLFERFLHA